MRTKKVQIVVNTMQLTRAADYAVRVMIHLASRPEGAVVSKAVLANATEAPESFLSKILQALARGGMIQARRGVVGGFSLLATGAEASLLDVIEIIDGPIALNVCLTSGTSCHRSAKCAAHNVWLRAQSAMLSVLREARIAEMASAGEPCHALQNIAKYTDGVELESKETKPLGEVKKSSHKAEARSADAAAEHVTSKHKI